MKKGWVNFSILVEYRTIKESSFNKDVISEIFDFSNCELANLRHFECSSTNTLGIQFRLVLKDDENYTVVSDISLQKARLICELLEYIAAKTNPNTIVLPKCLVYQDATTFNSDSGKAMGRASVPILDIPKYTITNSERILESYMSLSDDAIFALNAFDMSLNTYDVVMRYFSLFCIIERIEKSYKKHSNAQKRYRNDQISKIEDTCNQIDDSLYGDIKSSLGKFTDIGRAGCLLNILKYMGVTTYLIDFEEKNIDKSCIGRLIKNRNALFHAGSKITSLERDLRILHAICLKIIGFLIEGSSSSIQVI